MEVISAVAVAVWYGSMDSTQKLNSLRHLLKQNNLNQQINHNTPIKFSAKINVQTEVKLNESLINRQLN